LIEDSLRNIISFFILPEWHIRVWLCELRVGGFDNFLFSSMLHPSGEFETPICLVIKVLQ
ncbi:MAG: hypothetical protein PVF42_10495, partial [Desulfobacterales bacterium]